ncbi:hypothetical protein L5I01_08155 [Gordonia sp. HY442]|uniref:hypothetical protein n=1 Tax=Gordonia zhenghanii TaxID=2911516 RepID=UPI001F305697|nr:hypothetical protein [Gordonia zhenghanii]MCF8603332.1 hypothetical protein [Gordonia zhenghanii]
MTAPGRGLSPYRASDRSDISAFVARARRADEGGVLRIHERDDARVGLWVRTGFDVLATRSVFGTVTPNDVVADAAAIAASLAADDEVLDVGTMPTIAWQGALPGASGFVHVDDVPAREVIDLARRGADVARDDSGALGMASSLLDQNVLSVTGGDVTVDVSMRAVFALTSMGFVRDAAGHEITGDSPIDAIASDEPVRVRASSAWLRLDARFGSVYRRRNVLSLNVS